MTQPSVAAVPYRILVSIGHDDGSNPVFAEAVQLVHGHERSELHVVHVIEEKVPATSAFGITFLDQQLEAAPRALEARLTPVAVDLNFHGRVIGHLRVGRPATAILQTAVDIRADVIVLGTNHRGGFERFVLGSVVEQVMREAHCPVMVVTSTNYTGLARSQRMDPPCDDCLEARAESANLMYWCERHGRPHIQTHVFEPAESTSRSSAPTGMRIV